MDFHVRVACQRFARQAGQCACCDQPLHFDLLDLKGAGAWHAHHIDGDSSNNTLGNCAVVCVSKPGNCHLTVAHGGNLKRGPLSPRTTFTLNRSQVRVKAPSPK